MKQQKMRQEKNSDWKMPCLARLKKGRRRGHAQTTVAEHRTEGRVQRPHVTHIEHVWALNLTVYQPEHGSTTNK
jgi:hypothetical protein